MKNSIFFLSIILFSTPSYAYLDPGSGSIIAQTLIFIAASIGAFFSFFKAKVKNIYKKFFKKEDDKKKLN